MDLGQIEHTAIKALNNHLHSNLCELVIDVDLENFFGTIDHELLIKALLAKIEDNRFIRYIIRMVKACVLSDGDLKKTDEGAPQVRCRCEIKAAIVA